MKTKLPLTWIATALGMALVLGLDVRAAETITLTDEGGATAEMEDSLVQDTFTRSEDDHRGRYADKIYVFRDHPEAGKQAISAIRFNSLTERIGEGRNILRAKLVLEATNASGTKPIEVVAYPLLEDWECQRMSWTMRMHDGKQRLWNAEPNPTHFNLTPAPSTSDSSAKYDMAERHDETPILAYAHRPESDNTSVAEAMDAEFDVTKIVRLWYEGTLPNYGWALVATGEGDYVRFMATNGEGIGPRLVIELE